MSPIIIFYVSKYLVDGLKILAGPAHWSQSSLHGSGFDPFICEKFLRVSQKYFYMDRPQVGSY